MDFQYEITRRAAMALLGSASLGLAVHGLPSYGVNLRSDELDKLLPRFSERSLALLRRLLTEPGYRGQIGAPETARLARNEGMNVDQLMMALIPLAQSYSLAPISNFHVGVVVRGASGCLYTGANIEIPGQCLGFAVHAEQSALSNAYMHEEESVSALAVGGAPCGHCRQFIEEISPDGEIMILTPKAAPMRLSVLLPSAFSPSALGMKHGAFPIRESGLVLANTPSDPLAVAALDAARKSYAPYSKSQSGVAIRTSKDRIYRGSYIENVAFNPSLSPLQIALAQMLAGGDAYSAISAVTLVEVPGSQISQRPVSEIVLGAIAPNVKLTVLAAGA